MNEIDSLLSNNLIGAEIDKELSLEFKGLNEDHPFYWNTINNNPKGDHGEYQTRGYFNLITFLNIIIILHSLYLLLLLLF